MNSSNDLFLKQRQSMIENQIKKRGIRNSKILEAFLNIPRHFFVPDNMLEFAYADEPLPIGMGQTISQPYIVALMTDLLKLDGKEKILEIGTGSGFQTAILSYLAKEVYTIELIPELSNFARSNLSKLNIKNVHFFVGDGTLGVPEYMPYDRIIFTAAAPHIPDSYYQQVNSSFGIILGPVGSYYYQNLVRVVIKNGKIKDETLSACIFVPLKGKDGF